MTAKSASVATLDRIVRVRKVKARQALVNLARLQTRQQAEIDLQRRVQSLMAAGEPDAGIAAANAVSARATSNGLLGMLAIDSAARFELAEAQRAVLATALARARAAVDAAIARRMERERE